jgi:hypothetical protein
MSQTAAAMLALLMGAGAPLNAELKIVSRTTTRTAATPPDPAPPPEYALFSEMMVQMIAPNEAVDMTALIGEKGARIEYTQSTFGMPAGVVLLVQPNGDLAMLDPKQRIYMKITRNESVDMWSQLGSQPVTSYKRTGEFQTIAGVKTERIAFEWHWPRTLPPEEKKLLSPNTPEAIVLTGDVWVAVDRFKQYTPMAVRTNGGLSSLGMTKLLEEGVALRSLIRLPTSAGHEIETIVTSLAEERAPASLFAIPAGYKLVTGK